MELTFKILWMSYKDIMIEQLYLNSAKTILWKNVSTLYVTLMKLGTGKFKNQDIIYLFTDKISALIF